MHRVFIEQIPNPYDARRTWTRGICEATHRVVETGNDFAADRITYTAVPEDPIERVVFYLDRDPCGGCDAEHVL